MINSLTLGVLSEYAFFFLKKTANNILNPALKMREHDFLIQE